MSRIRIRPLGIGFGRGRLVAIGAAALAGFSFALGYGLLWTPSAPSFDRAGDLARLASPAPETSAASEDSAWDDMTGRLEGMARRYWGEVAIELVDLNGGRHFLYHPDHLFPAASLIKVPIMACVFWKIHEGGMSLDQVVALRRGDRRAGSGSLKWRPYGTRLTVRELLRHMITESDNTAAAIFIRKLGLGYMRERFARMGLLETSIHRAGMSIRSGYVANENYTTAREISMLMLDIYRGRLIDPTSSHLMLELLREKKAISSRLAKGLPRGWEIAHKTGLLRKACHDSAIFFTPQGSYLLTVLTGRNPNYRIAKSFITRLGHETFGYWGAAPSSGRSSLRHLRRHLALR